MVAPSGSFTPFTKWLQSKILHVEVTFSVYIFTPLEKFLFWSFVFLLFSLTAIATILYLPHHILFLAGRAWFYIHGDSALEVAKETARTLVQHAASTTTRVLAGSETARAVAAAAAAGLAEDLAKAEL